MQTALKTIGEKDGFDPAISWQEEENQRDGKVRKSRTCLHCRSRELKRQPYDWRAWVLARTWYKCSHCNKRTEVISITWRLYLALVLACTVTGAAFYYTDHPLPWVPGTIGLPLDSGQNAGTRALTQLEDLAIRRPKTPLTNQQVLDMTRAKLGPEVIVRLVRTSAGDYDLSAAAVIGLSKGGVAEAVILAMIDSNSSTER